jgi:hypothetical protein
VALSCCNLRLRWSTISGLNHRLAMSTQIESSLGHKCRGQGLRAALTAHSTRVFSGNVSLSALTYAFPFWADPRCFARTLSRQCHLEIFNSASSSDDVLPSQNR